MSEYPIASDGLIARDVGDWSKDKFYYLKRACFIFSRGMKRKWRNRCFIDLFSGPGIATLRNAGEEIEGSPLIALGCEEPFTHYYFVDAHAPSIEALKKRTEKYYPNVQAHYWAEDCNAAVTKIIHQIPTLSTLSLAFIDPTGVQIHMSTIADLSAGNRKVDLLINYAQNMAVQRLTTLPSSEPELDAFFGTHDWKSIRDKAYARGEHEGDALRELYKSQLNALGYKAPSFRDQLIRSDRRQPLYYLLYASKHERGIDFWKKISKRDHTGQEDLFDDDDFDT